MKKKCKARFVSSNNNEIWDADLHPQHLPSIMGLFIMKFSRKFHCCLFIFFYLSSIEIADSKKQSV